MATSTLNCCFNSSTTFSQHAMSMKTHVNPPLKIRTFSHIPLTTTSSSIKVLCKQGSLKEAFQLLGDLFTDQNSLEKLCPEETCAPVLELCAGKKALLQGQQIHAHVIKSSFMRDSVFLSTKLVFMYGKCGSIFDAQKMFDKMSNRTTFTWNAMIGAYVSGAEPLRALKVYREMRVSGIPLDAVTFVSTLKACGILKNHSDGAEIHGVIIKCGHDSIGFIVNALVAMYAKCNNIDGARKLFDSMNERDDLVLWNSIISAYSANGQSTEALKLFREMQVAGLATNTYTCVAALQACGDSSFEKLGNEVHAVILKSNQHLDVYVANALIGMHAKSGKMAVAVKTFDQLHEKDNVSWNTMLTGFVQNGLYMEAMQFFHELQEAGIKADQVSVTTILAASGRLENLLNGMEMHAYAVKMGYDSDLQIGNTLVDMYAKCCHDTYMGRVFDKMPIKDFISWTTIITGYTQNNSHVKALELFREAQIERMDADAMMIGSILLACSGSKCMSHVKEIHGYIIRRDLSDLMLQNTVVDVYGQCGNIDYATRTFQWIKCKDVVSWTSIISSYVDAGLANEAFKLFHSMRDDGVEPDSIAVVSILSAAASLSGLNKGKEIHCFIIRNGFPLEGTIANSLVDMYARCGLLEKAYKVFNGIRNKGLVLWTTMITAYGMHGHAMAAINLFYRMQDENIAPDHITFLALLNACSHSGLIVEGRRIFEIMTREYGFEPWPEHYACLVDIFGRANRLEEAYSFVKNMETEPTAEVWCALLNACRVHSNKELGEFAAQKLLQLDPDNPGNYVLVSNVFAASGRWKDVEQVRMKMRKIGLKKNPGCSWIEVGNKVHSFIARDKFHPESDEIYQKLAQITDKLEKEGGYVAETKFVLHDVEEEVKVKMLYGHSERLAIAYGLLNTSGVTPLRITKNLRVCGDCHTFFKLISRIFEREIVMRDANRFHHFEDGICSCRDFW